MITQLQMFKTLKPTLDSLTTESLTSPQYCLGKVVQKTKMKHGYAEETEAGGTTLLVEKAIGAPMAPDDIILGGTVRYIPKTMAKCLPIAEEAMEDCQYVEELLKPSKRLMASAKKTQDIDAASLIINSTLAAATGGYDGLCLGNSSHVLPSGGTQSNILSVYGTPSQQILQLIRAQLAQMKGPNGLIDPRKMEQIVCPEIQVDVWKTILQSEKVTGSNFNDINITKSYGAEIVGIPWLDLASSTQWGVTTDADDGLQYKEKRAIKSTTWVDNSATVMYHGISYRGAIGWSNWRHWFQGNI
jgi:hypothetical protein